LRYYDTNVAKSITLLQAMRRHHVERIVFSSSAAVYGDATGHLPETTPRAPATPYARSKAMLEDVLHDAATAGALRAIVLRYFNPVGADLLMRVGRSAHAPKPALQHLLDACWNDEVFTIAGDDWDTHDGTPLRDFVDVTDLAHAHRHAVERFETITTPEQPYQVFNIGTGTGTTIGSSPPRQPTPSISRCTPGSDPGGPATSPAPPPPPRRPNTNWYGPPQSYSPTASAAPPTGPNYNTYEAPHT
jgi:UDP-glucose 4-epimerase